MKRIVPRGWRLPAAVIVVLGLAGGAYAAIPDAAGVVHGCYKLSGGEQGGQLRVVGDPESCRRNEAPIQWNEQGVAGPAGPAGVDGADGQNGQDGRDGADGSGPTVAQLAAGHHQCPAGGAAITDAEGTTAYVCSGAEGADGAPFSGTFTSPNGQFSISVTDTGVTVASPDSAISVTDGAIRVETLGPDLIELRAANRLELRSGANFLLQAGGTASLSSGGRLSAAGSQVFLGNGVCVPAARKGDAVVGDVIFGGSFNVCIG